MEIRVKTVAFNLNCPDQKKLWEHLIQRTNFSAYMKRLIDRDMQGYRPAEKPNSGERKYMEGFI
ncbi:MAG: hypothetical protein JM58_09370 [Peptococcaceae bacterium BICA1-8]|nr:MAG: hypothetical protein JM58_09370 [Peptococcaceae bacterium BICA1-8]